LKRIVGNALLVFLPLLPVFSQSTYKPQDPSVRSVRFQANGRDTVFTLPDRFLIFGTAAVQIDGALQSNARVSIECNTGIVRFISPPDSGSIIQITYQSLPVTIKPEYRRSYPAAEDALTSGAPETKPPTVKTAGRARPDYAVGEELQRSGSIFRGVTLGTNQGMRLESGLRLQVSGKVAPHVEVVASLTDQNTPIQPEGNTQTLQEIDKVFVQMKAPHFNATLGDFVFEQAGTRFGAYSRKLQGASAAVEAPFGSVTLLASASKGEFTTHYFQGQESSQGPYQLTGSRGQRDIIVLAGTERVTIDGEPMTRGEDNDYVIEYGTGQVTFTRKRLITGDSRIAVEFEFSDQKFQKAIYGAAGQARFWNDRISVRTLFIRESDNKDNPLDFTMTEPYRDALERAGDNPDSAAASGVQYTGAGLGGYARSDSAGLVFYRYVGQGRGDYQVRFSYAGPGKGDYAFQGYGMYRYEGPGRGAYIPVLYLPMPKTHQLADAALSVRLGEGVYAEGEMAVSSLDLNQFSGRDDGDNSGTAATGLFRVTERALTVSGKSLGKIGLEGGIKNVGDPFRPLGRINEVEYGRKWGTAEGVTWGEKTRELKGTYVPFDGFRVSGETGAFNRGNAFRSTRHSAGLDWTGPKTPTVKAASEWIETANGSGLEGFWLRRNGLVEAGRGSFRPRLTYDGEHKRDTVSDTLTTGFKFDEVGAALSFERRMLRFELGGNMRDDRQYNKNRLERYSLAQTQKAELALRGSEVNGSMIITHRNRDFSDPSLEDQKTDLADLKFGFALFRRFVDAGLNYQFSSTQVSEMVKDTLRVGQGLGNYRYDPDLRELVPDPDGDLLYRTVQTGTFLPVNDLKMAADIRTAFSRLFRRKTGAGRHLGRLAGRSLIRVERRDKERRFWKVNGSAFDPDWGNDGATVTGFFSVLQDMEYTAPGGKAFVRLRLRKDDSENNQLLQENLVRHALERSVQFKGNPTDKTGFSGEFENRHEFKTYRSGVGVNRDIGSNGVSFELSYRPKQTVEFALKGKFRKAEDRFPSPHSSATSLFALPRFSYSIRERGQVRAELELGKIRSTPSGRALPYEMFNGDQPGQTLRTNLLLTYKVASHVMATASYHLRREPWQKKTYQTMQVEARAFF
jgi:hypothetical protein